MSLSANSSNASYVSEYFLGKAKDGDRLRLQHDLLKPDFIAWINQILDDYGLAERLTTAAAKGEKVRILDFGCGEGLYLHDIAQILQERGWLTSVELIGIDINPNTIAAAKEIAQTSSPAWPHLKFFVHDGTKPLAECEGLYPMSGSGNPVQAGFDLIYAQCAFQHLPNAQQHVKRVYDQELLPGGVLFIREPINKEASEDSPGWRSVHPAIRTIQAPSGQWILNINDGISIGFYEADWLKAAGAVIQERSFSPYPVGGKTLEGQQMLRNMLLFLRNGALNLVAKGTLTQTEVDKAMNTFETEYSSELEGVFTLANTIAGKPLE